MQKVLQILACLLGITALVAGGAILFLANRYGSVINDGIATGVDVLAETEIAVRMISEDFAATTGILSQVTQSILNTKDITEETRDVLVHLDSTLTVVRGAFQSTSSSMSSLASPLGSIVSGAQNNLNSAAQRLNSSADLTVVVSSDLNTLIESLNQSSLLLTDLAASVDSFFISMSTTGETFNNAADRLEQAGEIAEGAISSNIVVYIGDVFGIFLIFLGLLLILLGLNTRKQTP